VDIPDIATSGARRLVQGVPMSRLHRPLATAGLAAALLVGSAGAALACPPDPRADPTTWEYGGVYDCSKVTYRHGPTAYTKPSPVAFVVIRSGRTYFVSDLGDANEGDRTYTFDKPIRFVITCLFTDA